MRHAFVKGAAKPGDLSYDGLLKSEGHEHVPYRPRHILLAVGEIADWRRVHAIVACEVPEALTGPRIERKHYALNGASQDHVAGRGHHAAPGRRDDFVFPLDVARQGID